MLPEGRVLTKDGDMETESGVQRLAATFKSVDWVIPAYIQMGFLSQFAATIERAPLAEKQDILKSMLPRIYNEDHLSAMLLGLYSQTLYVRDFKAHIAEAIEAWHAGLHHAAVATMIPVLEGVVRKIAKEAKRDVGNGTQKLIAEFDELVARENRSPHRYEERVVMLTALRDFFADRLLAQTKNYNGQDQLNRHGILHGIFEEYGDSANFFRLITLLELLCFAMILVYGGSAFAPDETPESVKLADYYRTLKVRSAERIAI
jgi:hypothetical protein